MKMIPLAVIADQELAASNVPEDDYPVWDVSTTYTAGERVIVLSTHSVYQSVGDSNVGNDPTVAASVVTLDNPTGAWVYVSKTNRWRAFDGRNSAKTRAVGEITYDITVNRTADVVAFMGLEATSVRVQIIDQDGTTVNYDETKQLLDTSSITTYFAYFTFVPDDFSPNTLFPGVPAYPGTTLRITIAGGSPQSTVAVSIIGYGLRKSLGTTLSGTTPSIVDYSTKEVDEFGEFNIVPRAFARSVVFNIAFATSAYLSISRALEKLRTVPAIYYDNDELTHDLIVLGFYRDFSPALTTNHTLASIEIIGVI